MAATWRIMFAKIRLIAARQMPVRSGDFMKRRMMSAGQTFLRSRTEGPSIAPALNERNIITQLCQRKRFICDKSFSGPRRMFCQLSWIENCGTTK